MPFSTLIVYEPLKSLNEGEYAYWKGYISFYESYWGGPTSPFGMWFGNEYNAFKKALAEHMDIDINNDFDGLFMKNEQGDYLVVPRSDSSNVFLSENIVPMEWFVLFSEDQRKNFFSHWGFNSIYYSSELARAKVKIDSCIKVIEEKSQEKNNVLSPFLKKVVDSLEELKKWLTGFHPEGNIVLSYGDICAYIQPYTLNNESSVSEINDIIKLINENDFEKVELNLKIFFNKWEDIMNKCTGNVETAVFH